MRNTVSRFAKPGYTPDDDRWTRLICDMVEHSYSEVINLRVEHFQRYERVSTRVFNGKEITSTIVDTPGDRIARVRRALDAAAWFASSACVKYCEVVGFHPSKLWRAPEWQRAIDRLLGLLKRDGIRGYYDIEYRYLVETARWKYAD